MREGTVLRIGCDVRSNEAELAPARIHPAGPTSYAEAPNPPGRGSRKQRGFERSNRQNYQNRRFPKPKAVTTIRTRSR